MYDTNEEGSHLLERAYLLDDVQRSYEQFKYSHHITRGLGKR